MTTPTLKDFWAIHDGDKWDGKNFVPRPPANPIFVSVDEFGKAPNRHRYLMIRDTTTDQIWGVEIHQPDSWTEEYEELFIAGPMKMKATPRTVVVYDYEVDNG